MQPVIEFIFDFASPNAYLAYRALPPILERTGAKLDLIPCLLGGIFKATGNKAPFIAFAPIKGKFEYEMLEVGRFVAKNKLSKFRLNPHFPVTSLMLMRGLIAARAAGCEPAYLEMGLRGMWEDGLKLDDAAVLAKAIDDAGLDSASLLTAAQSEPVKQKLAATRPRRSSAASLASRPSSSARRCSSARSGCRRSSRRSRRRRRGFDRSYLPPHPRAPREAAVSKDGMLGIGRASRRNQAETSAATNRRIKPAPCFSLVTDPMRRRALRS